MGFTISKNPGQTIWVPVDGTDTLYEGQIVTAGSYNNSGTITPETVGLKPLGSASGNGNTTNKRVPFGVVKGTNNRTALFDTTYKGQYITGVTSQANQIARDWIFAEGMYGKGETKALVQVEMIEPSSVLRGRIYNGAYGTLIGVDTVSSVSDADGTDYTAGAADFTPVAKNHTVFCRSGLNQGLYRLGDGTSTTAIDLTSDPYPYDIAANDTFVAVNVRSHGVSRIQFDAESTYVENSAALTSDFYYVNILGLDLATAGAEYVYFQFNPVNFDPVRA